MRTVGKKQCRYFQYGSGKTVAGGAMPETSGRRLLEWENQHRNTPGTEYLLRVALERVRYDQNTFYKRKERRDGGKTVNHWFFSAKFGPCIFFRNTTFV